MNWIEISDLETCRHVLQKNESGEIPLLGIFKHSTRCSISHAAKARMERDWKKNFPETPVYYIDLLANRSVSQFISEYSGIRHESPQLIVFKEGKPLGSWSHSEIRPSDLQW
jgi:bacillithiol system protein YtxJ